MFKKNINHNIDDALMLLVSDSDKALESFENLLENDNNNIIAINGKGIALMKLEKYDKAEACFKSSISIEENAVAYLNLGLINNIYQNFEESNNYFNKAITLNSELKEIITVLKSEFNQNKTDIKKSSILDY